MFGDDVADQAPARPVTLTRRRSRAEKQAPEHRSEITEETHVSCEQGSAAPPAPPLPADDSTVPEYHAESVTLSSLTGLHLELTQFALDERCFRMSGVKSQEFPVLRDRAVDRRG